MNKAIRISGIRHIQFIFALEVAAVLLILTSPIIGGSLVTLAIVLFYFYSTESLGTLKLLLFLIPFFVLVQISNLAISTTTLFIYLIGVAIAIKLFMYQDRIISTKLHLPIFLFFVFCFLSLSWCQNQRAGIVEIVRWASFLLVYFITVIALNRRTVTDAINLIWLLLSVASFVILFGFYELLSGRQIGRLSASFAGPNTLGAYLVLVLPIALSLCFSSLRRLKKLVVSVISILLLAGLFLTGSRGSWLGVAASLVPLVIYKEPKQRRKLVKSLLLLALLGIIILNLCDFGSRDVLHIKGVYKGRLVDTAQVRLFQYSAIWDLIKENIFLGHGIGSFRETFESFLTKTHFPLIDFTADALNIYLQIWLELGLVGLCIFLLILFRIFKTYRNLILFEQSDEYRAILVGLLGAFIGFLMHGMVDAVTYSSAAFLLWFQIGLLFTLAYWKTRPSYIKT